MQTGAVGEVDVEANLENICRQNVWHQSPAVNFMEIPKCYLNGFPQEPNDQRTIIQLSSVSNLVLKQLSAICGKHWAGDLRGKIQRLEETKMETDYCTDVDHINRKKEEFDKKICFSKPFNLIESDLWSDVFQLLNADYLGNKKKDQGE